MAEFFKAVVKCDVTMAKAAPMYIDQTAVLEELYKHDRLVEQTLRTKQFLEQLEAEENVEKTRLAEHLLGPGTKVTSPYKEPPISDEAKAKHPTERNLGSRALQRNVENRLSIWRKDLDDKLSSLSALERTEKERDDKERERRARDAERELNALVVSRQIAAHEAQQERQRQQAAEERSHRRVHPIDVLQKKIAVDLMQETQQGALDVAARISQEARGIDQIVEAEQLRAVRYQYHHPIKHVPQAW
jgi:hypothetical protein